MIVFDLDDTLYLERDFAFSGYQRVDDFVTGKTGVTGFGATCRHLFEAGERAQIFNRACAVHGLDWGQDDIAELVETYRFHDPSIALCPDVGPFLDSHAGPFGLITDGPERTQRNKIAALGLKEWIAHIRPTGAWPEGFGKPHPRAFAEMEDIAGPAPKMVYVADNPAKDFVTPNARGWLTVQVRRDGAIHAPDPPDHAHAAAFVITSLSDFPLLV